MERLTKRNETDTAYYYPACFGECYDLGSRPECDQCDFSYSVCEKLGEYEDLEEQGKLLKLPCAVGDTVWDNDFGLPRSYTVTGFSFGKIDDDEESDIEGLWMYYRNLNSAICCSCAVSEIGKTVFLTKEQAKEVLQKKESKTCID